MKGRNHFVSVGAGVAQDFRGFGDLADGRARPVPGKAIGGSHNGIDIGAGYESGGDGGGEDAGGFKPIALLMTRSEGDGLVIGALRIASVHDPDGGDVHGGAAIDHVADATLARIAGGKLVALEYPFFRIEQAFEQRSFALKFGDVALDPGDLAHEAVGHVPGIDVASHIIIDGHQRERHQRVVGNDAVAPDAAIARRRVAAGAVPLIVERCHTSVHGLDFGRCELFYGRPDSVAESDAMEQPADPPVKGRTRVLHECH